MSSNFETLFPGAASVPRLTGTLLAACAWALSVHAQALPTDKGQNAQGSKKVAQQNASRAYDPFATADEEDCLDETRATGGNAPLGLNLSSSLSSAPAKNNQHSGDDRGDGANSRLLLAALPKDLKTGMQKNTVAQETPRLVTTNEAAAPRSWEIAITDKTLNAALARWTSIAGWQLSWELPVDYAVEVRTSIPGSFEQAVETVAKSMDGAEIPMQAIFYSGNKVLRIVQRGAK